MIDANLFGVYLYGSETTEQTNISSDIEVVLFGFSNWTLEEKMFIHEQLIQKFPQWKNKFFDACFVQVPNVKPPGAKEMAALCWLKHYKSTLVLGSDLFSSAYQPNWNDFFESHQSIVHNWQKVSHDADAAYIYKQCLHSGNTKPLYNLCYSLALYCELIIKPQAWIFETKDMSHPLIAESKEFLRTRGKFETPKNEVDLFKLKVLCQKIHHFAMEVKKLATHTTDGDSKVSNKK